MGDWEDDFKFDEKEWEDVSKKSEEKRIIERAEYTEDGDSDKGYGFNVAFTAFEQKGKSLMATLFGFLNTKYFDMIRAKERYPKTYEMIKSGLIPEVEKVQVLDLDASYKKLSHLGAFGKLVRPLYKDNVIKSTTIKIPKRKIDFLNKDLREVAMMDIDRTKIKIENEITIATRDNGPEVALIIDSMSSYDELLNDKFRIIYENVIAKEDERGLGASLKGIRQSYWTIRNGWWVETLRDKRTYRGWQIDTYKIDEKADLWLEKEINAAIKKGKDPNDILPYRVQWAPRTKFELDLILQIDNDGDHYWTDVENRFQGNVPKAERDRIYYQPNSRSAIYEILEKLSPYIQGESDKTEEELW